MVNQELSNGYPFERMGTHVYGERFVGRTSEVRKLQLFCTFHNYSIQGLPKIGKTSLAYHSVIYEKDKVTSKKPLCTIFYDVAANRDSTEFFHNLIALVADKVLAMIPEDKHFLIKDQIAFLEEEEYKNGTKIVGFFSNGLDSLDISVVVVFDEFDKVRTLFTGTDFSVLRSVISTKNFRGIFISKRSIQTIEGWMNKADGGPSNFFQCFQNSTIHLGPFLQTPPRQDDMRAYWSRLTPYFKAIGLDLCEEYKSDALFYSGRLPHVLDLYNSLFYEEFCASGERPNRRDLVIAMQKSFESAMVILKDQELLYPAIQAIIGPVYDLNQKQLDLLLGYGFLREVSPDEKLRLIGINAGYVDVRNADGAKTEIAYVGPSDFFTLLFKKVYYTQVDFWKEWETTFVAIRNIAGQFLIDNWGENWSEISEADPVVSELKKSLDKDISAGLGASPLLEYLNEYLLMDFLYRNRETFKSIFGDETFFDKFRYLMYIRNHYAHINYKFLTKEDRDKANTYLSYIRECINQWKKTGDCSLKMKLSSVLSNDKATQTQSNQLEGIVKYDSDFGCYHVGDYMLPQDKGNKLKGRKIHIASYSENINEKCSKKYPYFVLKVKLI